MYLRNIKIRHKVATMKYTLTAPAKICGSIQLPSSKSISNRALILKALSGADHSIGNLSQCDDTNVMLRAFAQTQNVIDIGAAGTSMRFLTAYLSQCEGEYLLTGSERMKNRPIHLLVEALRSIGADIQYAEKEGFPPLRICGKPLEGGNVEVAGNISSQFISALMMIAPTTRLGLTIRLKGEVISQPYIRMTLKLMEAFGVQAQWTGNTISIPPQTYRSAPFMVEGDWSAASYWYEMAALTDSAEVELLGLFAESTQGDSFVAKLFEQLGVATEYTERGVILRKTGVMVPRLEYDFVHQPDLAQTFVVTCCLLNVPFHFTGLQSLKIKETDRIEALKTEMRKLGYVVHDYENSIMEWTGERIAGEATPVIATYEDHRMAMAFAPAALHVSGLQVAEPQVVSKSYPNYWEHLRSVGFSVVESK